MSARDIEDTAVEAAAAVLWERTSGYQKWEEAVADPRLVMGVDQARVDARDILRAALGAIHEETEPPRPVVLRMPRSALTNLYKDTQ